ncbi:unnamed protein product [Didymodactylos carnosus]|uniref:RRM domain-containing protein n=1 Tax=Didymodactylos carnosus TaxID=1234261 RepID=A0A814KW59_9BILA|nr:unnamed protein product [Didymodactylos carnosus]CAF1056608.1 unnamed protein product [Didymodactylos carnosus]CAF3788340.1 unnamed protein product [Didymodactylos carnosus]CAF3825543.1 unnamed protein product [Didymodactylos carnosus]
MMSSTFDENTSRTLYVGNLENTVTEDLLLALFTQIGPCKGCKIIHEPGNDPYAFIEFNEHQIAAHALLAMNKRLCMGKEMKVNWATTSGHQSKVDTSKHFHIFVGDLAPEIDQNTLRDAFSPFGDISEIKIARFSDTGKPKGYCFIAFTNKNDAETAIASMNGQWLGTRKIRTNWATRKAQTGHDGQRYREAPNQSYNEYSQKLDYNEVWQRTGEANSTVYLGGISDVNEELVRNIFHVYGQIQEIRVFKEKGYAFVKFFSKDSACQAICNVHGMDVNGYVAKCGWGRDDGSMGGLGGNNSQDSSLSGMNSHMQHMSQNLYQSPSNDSIMSTNSLNQGQYGYTPNYTQQYMQNQQQSWNMQTTPNMQSSTSLWDGFSNSNNSAAPWRMSQSSYPHQPSQYTNPKSAATNLGIMK